MTARNGFDAVIVGSGIGGLSCAAALAKLGRRALVLEQHTTAGGLTHMFARDGFTWDVGVHYLGDMGTGGQARRLFDWLSGGRLEWAPLGEVYEIVRFPGGFEFRYPRSEGALRRALAERFPDAAAQIETFFAMLAQCERESFPLLQLRAMPRPMAALMRPFKARALQRWWGRTIDEVMVEAIPDPQLRAVLTAQWPDHGGRPSQGSFALHATILRFYLEGGYYPVGGARSFADTLLPVIAAAGGAVETGATVERILIENGRAVGVVAADGRQWRAPHVVSDSGARTTVDALLPEPQRSGAWAARIRSLGPSPCHLCLYLGLEGDVQDAGATRANHWIYESWDVDGATWRDPFEQAQASMLYVSFPSLKDPKHDPGARRRHTAEVVTWADWSLFEPWASTRYGERPPEYAALKESIENALLAQFGRHFPRLGPMVALHELSTPLTATHFLRREQGAIYGLEATPRRFLSDALNIRTPIKGLYLAGQDVFTTGVVSATMAGVYAAAAIDPRLFRALRTIP